MRILIWVSILPDGHSWQGTWTFVYWIETAVKSEINQKKKKTKNKKTGKNNKRKEEEEEEERNTETNKQKKKYTYFCK